MLFNPHVLQYVESKIKCQFIWKLWGKKKEGEGKCPCGEHNLISSSLELKGCSWQGKHLTWMWSQGILLFLMFLEVLGKCRTSSLEVPPFVALECSEFPAAEGRAAAPVCPVLQRAGERWIKADKWMLPSASWGGTEIREQVLNCLAWLLVLVMQVKTCSGLWRGRGRKRWFGCVQGSFPAAWQAWGSEMVRINGKLGVVVSSLGLQRAQLSWVYLTEAGLTGSACGVAALLFTALHTGVFIAFVNLPNYHWNHLLGVGESGEQRSRSQKGCDLQRDSTGMVQSYIWALRRYLFCGGFWGWGVHMLGRRLVVLHFLFFPKT